MTVISLHFLGGRFHGTPWGRHVNEGAVEWPPSPWRLLRALLATWYAKAAEIRGETARRLLDRLAEAPPSYTLPKSSLGHTRHYLPFNEGRNEKTTKVFDTFIHVPKDERVYLHWEAALEPELRGALATLLARLGYFGRAESLVEGRLLGPEDGPVPAPNTFLLSAIPEPSGSEEIVRLLAPLPPNEYAAWRQGYIDAAQQLGLASADDSPGKKKAPRTAKKASAPNLPPDLFAALHADTGELQASGWALPPGARPLAFVRSARSFDIAPVRHRTAVKKAGPTVARYAVASAVPPRLTSAVSVADRVHQSLVKWSGNHPVFTGRGEDGEPRRDHQHAHIFCEVSDQRDAITHLTIFAREGFDAPASLALRQLNKVWGHGGHDLQLVLLGFGHPGDFAGPDASSGQSTILRKAREWVSLTPFVPTRHGKRGPGGAPKLDADNHQIGGPRHDLLRLLRQSYPGHEPLIVDEEDAAPTHPPLRWLQFQRRRTTGQGARAGSGGFGFRVRFATEIEGPVAVGYGAHFGLGLFQPVPVAAADKF